MLREDGTAYFSKVEVKTSISLNGQEISTTPTTTGDNVSIDSTGMTNVTATDVQGAIAQLDNLVGGGGSGGDGAINGEYVNMTNAGTNNIVQLTNPVTLPVGWSEVQVESEYVLSTGTSSATRFEVYSSDITPVNNITYVDYGVRAIGLNRDSHTFYVNNTGSESTVILRITTDAGTVTSAKSRLLVKSLATAPTIVQGITVSHSGGGGGGI